MLVRELITELQKANPEHDVIILTDDGGYDIIEVRRHDLMGYEMEFIVVIEAKHA